MEKKEKGFNLKLYAVIAFFAVLSALVLITVFTFKSKYTAYHPEAVARTYVDTIVQTADGYNAYKNTLVSKSQKYGDFIREYYMNPVIYRDTAYQPGDDIKDCGYKGFNDKSYMGEKTKNDDGTLQGQVIDTMYDCYAELVRNGWDDYDTIFTEYFAKLVEVRKAVFGDEYMTDEIMFTALESNVLTYGKSLTGTEDVFDENTGLQTSFKSVGAYQTAYGEDYKLTAAVKAEKEMDSAAYKASLPAETLATYGVQAADIGAVKCYTVAVSTEDGKEVAQADIVVAQIQNSWYVDNTATDTSALYNFYQ